jgi:folate-binding protein YgfZ
MSSPHLLARHGALLVHRDDLAALVVSGPDRFSWLQGMLSCDLAPVQTGHAVYGLVLDKQGKIVADILAMPHEQSVLLAVDRAKRSALQDHLDHFLIMEDAEITLLAEPHAFVLAIGPRATDVTRLAARDARVLASCSGRLLGTSAALLFCSLDQAPHVVDSLLSTDDAFGNVTTEAFDALRVDLGIPGLDRDFGPANYPMEIGLDDHAISFQKGCYVGQEVVVKLRSRGKPVRVLKRLAFDPGDLPAVQSVVSVPSGKETGVVTSVGRSEQGLALAFALVRRADVESSTTVVVEGRQARILSPWGPVET